MRFDRRKSSPLPKLVPASHSRLWGLFLAMTFVLLSIKIAADPSTWSWLFPAETDQTTAEPSLAEVTYDVDLAGEDNLRSDEFLAKPAEGAAQIRQPLKTVAMDGRFGEDHLSAIRDNTLSIRAEEHRALISILAQLGETKIAADDTATYPAVMLEPEHYRGRLISIEGTARRVTELVEGALAPGTPTLYEVWVFTSDSGNNPWRVLAKHLPEELRPGSTQANASVRLSGVFFKRQGYETVQQDLHVAPVLLAENVAYVRSLAPPPNRKSASSWLIIGLTLASASLVFFMYRLTRMRRAIPHSTKLVDRSPRRQPDGSADETVDPSEFLASLASNPLNNATAEDGSERTKDVHS